MVKPITWETIQVRLGDLEEWEKNPAKISPKDARELRASIKRFGFVLPFVAAAPPNGSKKIPLADGHQRKTVSLQLLELAPETFVDIRIPSRKLSEAERSELAIRLRKNVGEWDEEKLREFFEKDYLLEWGFEEGELEEMGFEILEEESKDAEPQIDKAEELLKKWKVKTGDLWELGPHRLICGDCTDRGVVARLLQGETISIIVTSPPYYNQREYAQWKTSDDYHSDMVRVVKNAMDHRREPFALVWNIGSSEPTNEFLPAHQYILFREAGLKWREWIVWNKESATWTIPRSQHIETGHYFPALKWESIIVFTGEKHPRFDVEDKSLVRKFQENVWEINKVIGSEQKSIGHTAIFPTEIPSRAIMAYSQKGAIVYDPFSGSGTTLIASHNLGRICRAVEISPAYVAVALQRFEDAFGIKPTLLERANGKK